MSACGTYRARLLDAAPAELSSALTAGRGALGRHLASCNDCRAAVERILVGLEGLEGLLAQTPRVMDVERVLARARTEGEAPPTTDAAASSPPPGHAGSAGPAGWSWWGSRGVEGAHPRRIAAALLAAAVVAFVLLQPPGTPPRPGTVRPAASPFELDVEVPEGRNVAVLPTTDPDITVLWLF